ncbi:MAG: LacI family DNA-binding transcriptional regulator [Chitinophagaceae bacterium]
MQQSTLKVLSETLGISVSTVSRALRDHPDISEKTKQRVKELAEALEYEPNNYAVQLRTRQSNILGILVPCIDNFFYDTFIAAVEEEARLQGYHVMIMQSRDSADVENANLLLFRKNRVSGLFASISIETEDMSLFNKLKESDIPVVFIDRVPEGGLYNRVCQPDEAAARLAAETIISRNKKNVLALFGHPHLSITKKRFASFTGTFAEKAPSVQLRTDYPENIEASRKAALAFLQQPGRPDVIFCMGDLILMGVMQAIHELNLKVPDEVAVISISNGLIPTLFAPKVTYVETSGYKLGKLAFSQMLKSLQQKTISEEVFVEAILVQGGSI